MEQLAGLFRVPAPILPKLVNGYGIADMIKFVIGFVLGLAVATVGFSGIARMLDRGVQTIQQTSKELAQ